MVGMVSFVFDKHHNELLSRRIEFESYHSPDLCSKRIVLALQVGCLVLYGN